MRNCAISNVFELITGFSIHFFRVSSKTMWERLCLFNDFDSFFCCLTRGGGGGDVQSQCSVNFFQPFLFKCYWLWNAKSQSSLLSYIFLVFINIWFHELKLFLHWYTVSKRTIFLCFRVGSCWVFIANTFFSPHQQSVLQGTTFRPAGATWSKRRALQHWLLVWWEKSIRNIPLYFCNILPFPGKEIVMDTSELGKHTWTFN